MDSYDVPTCSNCCGKIDVREFNTWRGSHIPEKVVLLCTYCAGSRAGNAYFYPHQYGDSGAAILCGVAAMMNKLEERLTKNEARIRQS